MLRLQFFQQCQNGVREIIGRPNWLTHSLLYPIQIPGIKILCVNCICIIMWHSHLHDMEISERKRFIPRGFEMSTTWRYPIWSISLRKKYVLKGYEEI